MFTFYRHMRTVGSLAMLVGIFINKWLFLAGIVLVIWSYIFAINKIEEWIENQKGDNDA